MMSDNGKEKYFYPFLIIVLSVLLYLPSIKVSFINDEIAFISRNQADNLQELLNLFDKKDYDGSYYRPLGNFVSGILTLFSGYDEIPYRIFNLLLNAFNGILVFLIVLKIPLKENDKYLVALFAGLFFISFPLNDYAVIWHTDLFDRLTAFFYLLSVFWFVKKKLPHVLSLIFFLLAILSKEMAFSLPAVIFLFSFLMYRNFSRALGHSFPYLIVLAVIIFLRWYLFNNNIFDLDDAHSFSNIESAIKNLVIFGGMLVFPFELRIIQNLFSSYPIFFYTAAFILIIILGIASVKYKRNDLVFFIMILVLIITIIPSSRLLLRWYLYLPSAFFCIILAYLLISNNMPSKLKITLAVIIFGIYYFTSLLRMGDWIEISAKGKESITQMVNEYYDEIKSNDRIIFLTIPAKVKDIPLFQLAFDEHLEYYLKQNKSVSVLSKSYLTNFENKIFIDDEKDSITLYHEDANYFMLSEKGKNIKFNVYNSGGNKNELHFIKEKEPYIPTFTFSEGKFYLIKDNYEN